MEENKDKELEKKPQEPVLDNEETVASAEDIEAFMRERRKARAEKKPMMERENPEVEEYISEESSLDPYLDPDPEIPWVKYVLRKQSRMTPSA